MKLCIERCRECTRLALFFKSSLIHSLLCSEFVELTLFTKVLYGKVFADRGYIKQELFESLFSQGIQLVHGLKAKMKNKLMPMWDKMMLRKRYTIECINELLKNKANLVHSRHRSIHNFIMNLCSALTAYCFFNNKPEALPVYVEKSKQLELFAY